MKHLGHVLGEVEPRQLTEWLRADGWTLVDKGSHAATFRKASTAEDDEFVVEVPLDSGLRDYGRRVREILDTLAVSSGRPLGWIVEEVRASTVDIVRLRSTGPSVGAGRVPILLAARLFEHTRELYLAAACAARDPRPVYRSRKPAEALELLRRVKVTAPSEGSFVITLHAPVPPLLQPALLTEGEEIPFERRATLMLAHASQSAREAAEVAALGGDADLFVQGAAKGISANLCDALSGLVDGDETTHLEMSFAWAPARAVPPETPREVLFNADLAPMFREAARVLRATGPSPDFELEGAVVQLDSADLDQGGAITVLGAVDGRPRRVKVQVERDDYRLALRAHEERVLFRCEGELVKRGTRFELDRARHAQLVSVDD
ncbi:MAG: hypothetical protein KF901_22665 [Myxococcales bacterium]|nr:hypothetical protein [Myxococcales bacterium]